METAGIKPRTVMSSTYFLMAVILFMWGSFAAVSKLVLGQIDSFQMQFYMFGFAFVVMTAVLIINGQIKELKDISSKDYLKMVLYSLPSYLYYFLYTLALKMIPAVEASMLNYLFPIAIVFFAAFINDEKLSRPVVFSIVLGLAGAVIIMTNGRFDYIKVSNIKGDMLAFGAAVMWGLFSNLIKRNRINANICNYVVVAASFAMSSVSLFVFSNFTIPDVKASAGLIWLSLSNIVLIYYLWAKALKLASAASIASITFITPFVTLVFIVFLIGERITYIQCLGLLVIVAGIAVQTLGQKGKRA